MKVLFQGWVRIPHSYACCFCFELVHFYKKYSGKVHILLQEQEYYMSHWKANKLIYSEEYNSILNTLLTDPCHSYTPYTDVDIVFRQTFPYDISLHKNDPSIPVCVFFTSEFRYLDPSYFHIDTRKILDEEAILSHLQKYKNISFTCPSEWSAEGMKLFDDTLSDRITVIPHGVDKSVFYKDFSDAKRKTIRDHYKIKEGDILILSIGSMTKNKGIHLLLRALLNMWNENDRKYKLMLKGTGDLYQSKLILQSYLEEIKTTINFKEFLETVVCFVDNTISYGKINDIFNACDLYASPYLAEGFGLVPLEALASGLPVLVPETGSTSEYINKMTQKEFIYKIPSTVVKTENGLYCNSFSVQDIQDTIKTFKKRELPICEIPKQFTWESVANRLLEMFTGMRLKN